MQNFLISKLIEGKPQDIKSEKAIECFKELDSLHINYQYVGYNRPPETKEELCSIDEVLQVKGIKNLIYKNKKGTKFYFIIIPREERFNEKEFRVKHEISKIEMAKPEDLEKVLKTHAGAVGIMELKNDTEEIIELYIDERILKNKFMRFHPNDNVGTVRIKMDDFINVVSPYLKHKINIL